MNQKDLIKWGVIALGAYLVWKYIQDHGGIDGLLGTGVSAHPGKSADCTALAKKVGGITSVRANDPLLQQVRGIVTLSADQEAMLKACGGVDLTADQVTAIGQATGKIPTSPPPQTQAPPPPQTIPPAAPLLDMTGLVVIPDVNDSFTGTVKINGIPVRLSIITADGRIFDSSGTEVTDSLTARGIDVVALRNAFQAAGAGLTGMTGLGRFTPAWLM